MTFVLLGLQGKPIVHANSIVIVRYHNIYFNLQKNIMSLPHL
uniref:Uncharacterized protein n=1 Tax=Anguilla anguilla TaxID=7936 RepID=A0A0E9QRE6_ANGAN